MRPTPESTPISSTFTRGTAGVGEGLGGRRGRRVAGRATSLGVTTKSGSSEATGGALPSGTQAPP